MADVFISYARANEKVARKVAGLLEKAGFSVWWDADLPAHRAYSEEIENNLREAKAVVVLWSKESAASQWVRAEADVARNAGKLVQLGIDRTVPPLPFNQIQCADLSGWRGAASHAGARKAVASVAALVGGERREPAAAPAAAKAARWPRLAMALGLLAVILVAGFALYPRLFGDSGRKPVVAVLPFEALGPSDRGLVAGIWEDTRQAISRNPQLTVLGPNSAEELASERGKSLRKLADYVIEATVRSSGDRVRISANLVRTRDGVALWSQNFDRKLDDVFALQSEIAASIEGHIRGRLAEKGGVRPENIATSGEVYALYSDARATLRQREVMGYERARDQLRQVVARDPNFAPGWATLAIAELLYGRSVRPEHIGFDPRSSERSARRAIALAPNLATGHSALGFALRSGPAARAALERALALDPNDAETLNWLASIHRAEDRPREALELLERVNRIEPLFWPAALNKLNLLIATGDDAAIEAEQRRVDGLGDALLSSRVAMEIARSRGDLSKAAQIGLAQLRADPERVRSSAGFSLFELLLQLGAEDEARTAFPPPPFGPLLWANDPRGLDMVARLKLPPERFFVIHPLSMNAGRVFIVTGRGTELAQIYRQAGGDPARLLALTGSDGNLASLAPFVALGLRQSGDEPAAQRLLTFAEQRLTGPNLERAATRLAMLARIHAVQGRRDRALAALEEAVRRGWLPTPPDLPVDLNRDPAFGSLNGDPRFEAARNQILAYLRKERAELGQISVG